MWSVWLGEISLARGRPATAAGYFQAALTAAGGDTHPYRQWLTRLALEDLARAAALCGDVALAASSLVKAQQHMRPWLGALDVWGGSSGAWLAVVQGETKLGIDIALAAAERARRDQQFGWELLALHQVVRLGLCVGNSQDGRASQKGPRSPCPPCTLATALPLPQGTV